MLHVTNYSSCGPEDGLQLTKTRCPVNFILTTLIMCCVLMVFFNTNSTVILM
jgi:hypothetical protein